jgi:hypothetical protein
MRTLKNARRLVFRYFGKGTSISFWHTPVGPRFYDFATLGDYYIDLRAKTGYRGPFDDAGIPILDYRGEIGRQYNPCAVAQYALGLFQRWREGDAASGDRFADMARWLIANQQLGGSRDGEWLYLFDLDAYGVRSPWPSALAQGQAVSVLLRADKFLNLPEARAAAERGRAAMLRPIQSGGLTRTISEGLILEEVVADRMTAILDGMIFSLFGLLDYAYVAGDADVTRNTYQYVDTIERLLPRYDLGYWSKADLYQETPPMLASAFYHGLHVHQLQVLAKVTGRPVFAEYAERWRTAAAGRVNRTRALIAKAKFKLLYY